MHTKNNLKNSLTDAFVSGQVLVMDGAMATSLYEKGFYINRSFEELNLIEPKSVKEVVKNFKKAGTQIFHTNTFNATVPKLTNYGLQDQLDIILSSSVKILRDSIGSKDFILGLVGPLGVQVEPLGKTSLKEAEKFFQKNFQIFKKEKVDGLAINGFHDLNEMRAALKAAQQLELPVFASVSLQENLKTNFGHTLVEFVELCEKNNVFALGICGEVGPSGMLSAVEQLRPLTNKPIYALPNAGLPRYVNDQYIYLCSPDYIGKYAKRLAQAGVNCIGGHCGVFEQHIKAISNSTRMVKGIEHSEHKIPIVFIADQQLKSIPIAERSRLGHAFDKKEQVVTVELVPPYLAGFSKFDECCQQLESAGVRFVNIPDGARAVARMSSLQLSSYILNKYKLEPIPHLTCRDRNLIGLQADILGASVNGVRNLLIVTGDPPKLGNTPGATAVYDVDAIGLTHIVSRMNHGLDLGGTSTGDQTRFLIGVALNPTAKNKKLEIERLKYKLEAGADYVVTQPIYNFDSFQAFFDQVGTINKPVLMGIWPLVSLRNAEFLKYEVPGVDVPDWVIEEMQKAGDSKEEAVKRGIEIAAKTIEKAKGVVAGFQISAPFNRVPVVVDVIQQTLN